VRGRRCHGFCASRVARRIRAALWLGPRRVSMGAGFGIWDLRGPLARNDAPGGRWEMESGGWWGSPSRLQRTGSILLWLVSAGVAADRASASLARLRSLCDARGRWHDGGAGCLG
jgi:hypothetical protein